MAKNVEVVTKYHFRKEGVLGQQGYDLIQEVQHCCLNLFKVKNEEGCGVVDSDENIVVPMIFEDVNQCGFGEDFIPIKKNGKWGFFNLMKKKVEIRPVFDEVKAFINGLAPVCINKKWGAIDKKGNMVLEPKYLLDFYFFDDFAIVFEGGEISYTVWNHRRIVSNSNCKIINKEGYEYITDKKNIQRKGDNIFTITTNVNGKDIVSIKQFVPYPDYIVVIDNGNYIETVSTAPASSIVTQCYKYSGGGIWSAIDYTGKSIQISDSVLQKAKEDLLAKN